MVLLVSFSDVFDAARAFSPSGRQRPCKNAPSIVSLRIITVGGYMRVRSSHSRLCGVLSSTAAQHCKRPVHDIVSCRHRIRQTTRAWYTSDAVEFLRHDIFPRLIDYSLECATLRNFAGMEDAACLGVHLGHHQTDELPLATHDSSLVVYDLHHQMALILTGRFYRRD